MNQRIETKELYKKVKLKMKNLIVIKTHKTLIYQQLDLNNFYLQLKEANMLKKHLNKRDNYSIIFRTKILELTLDILINKLN